jgi:hypothetical protein
MRLALSKGPNRAGAFLLSPVDGNTSGFRKVGFLVFRILDDRQSSELQLFLVEISLNVFYIIITMLLI